MLHLKVTLFIAIIVTGFPSNGQTNLKAPKYLDMPTVLSYGPQYNYIKAAVGTWNVEQKTWSDSLSTPVAIGQYMAVRTLKEHFLEEVMQPLPNSNDKPFQRIVYLNFNNANFRWEYVVMDTRYPVIMYETSADDQINNTLVLYLPAFIIPPGMIDEHGGLLTKQRRVITFVSNDETLVRQYWTLPGGKEFLAIQYTYTRVKASGAVPNN